MRRIVCLAFALAGCSSYGTAPTRYASHYVAPAEEPAGYAPPRSEGAPAPEPMAERPRERPGLGTTWGENRESRVREVAFRRAADEPFSVGSVFYNDRHGADAMASWDARRAGRLDAPVPMSGGLTVSVVDEGGLPLEAFSLNGHIYVVGEHGRRYSIVISNLTDRRYEAVVSVDGLDVLDGEAASVRKRGYLVAPHASITVEGFRKTLDEVAAFRFGSVSQSYAGRTGRDRNVGVIGFAFFHERGSSPWTDDEIARRRTADPFAGDRFALPPE
jgi:hypothetical protein